MFIVDIIILTFVKSAETVHVESMRKEEEARGTPSTKDRDILDEKEYDVITNFSVITKEV